MRELRLGDRRHEANHFTRRKRRVRSAVDHYANGPARPLEQRQPNAWGRPHGTRNLATPAQPTRNGESRGRRTRTEHLESTLGIATTQTASDPSNNQPCSSRTASARITIGPPDGATNVTRANGGGSSRHVRRAGTTRTSGAVFATVERRLTSIEEAIRGERSSATVLDDDGFYLLRLSDPLAGLEHSLTIVSGATRREGE